MTSPLYRCWTKAISEQTPGEIMRSHRWVTARRGWLQFHADQLVCGDWVIPTTAIREVVLYKGWSFPWPVAVLEVVVGQHGYQFGLNPWCRVERYLSTPYRTEKLRLGYTPFSVVVRLLALGYVGYLVWTFFH